MKIKEIKVTLPIPPSINGLYSGMERRFKSKVYKEWIREANASLMCERLYIIKGNGWLEVSYTYYTPLFNKGNGEIKKWDVFNFEKALSDLLGEWITGFDDRKIIKGTVEKVDSSRREVEVVIREIP